MESVKYREQKKRGYAVNVGVVPVAEANKDGTRIIKQYEVDFIATMDSEKLYVQSAYRIDYSFRKVMVECDLYLPYMDKNVHMSIDNWLFPKLVDLL